MFLGSQLTQPAGRDSAARAIMLSAALFASCAGSAFGAPQTIPGAPVHLPQPKPGAQVQSHVPQPEPDVRRREPPDPCRKIHNPGAHARCLARLHHARILENGRFK